MMEFLETCIVFLVAAGVGLTLPALLYLCAYFADRPSPLRWAGGPMVGFAIGFAIGMNHGTGAGICLGVVIEGVAFLFILGLLSFAYAPGGTLPFQTREEHRFDHGLCLRCGYDLRATSRPGHCPECGAAIPTLRSFGWAAPRKEDERGAT